MPDVVLPNVSTKFCGPGFDGDISSVTYSVSEPMVKPKNNNSTGDGDSKQDRKSDEKLMKVMSKRVRRSSAVVNREQYKRNRERERSWNRFKIAHKKATLLWRDSLAAQNAGVCRQKPMSIRQIVKHVNENYLGDPGDYEVKNSTIRKYVDVGKAGVSPEKRGRPKKIPDILLTATNFHATGMQASGETGEADKPTMMATIDAMVEGTRFEKKLGTNAISRDACAGGDVQPGGPSRRMVNV